MRKKLLALGLSLCVAAGTVGALNVHTANAAIKDVTVGENIFTDKGILNELDWALKGDTAKTSFTEVNKGYLYELGTSGRLCATVPANFTESEAVKIEVDVLGSDFMTMGPVVTSKKLTYEKEPPFFVNSTCIDTTPTGGTALPEEGKIDLNIARRSVYYADEAMTTKLPKVGVDGFTGPPANASTNYAYVTADNPATGESGEGKYVFGGNLCVMRAYPYKVGTETVYPYGTHVEYIVKSDKTFGLRSTPYKADGTLDETLLTQVWVKGMLDDGGLGSWFPPKQTTGWFYGLRYAINANTYQAFDNFKVTAIMRDPEEQTEGFEKNKVIGSTDFTGNDWGTSEAVYNDGSNKIYYQGGSGKRVQEIVATPANTDRIVSELKVKTDPSVAKAFTLNASLDFRTLGKKFGFAFGLQDQMGAINAKGVSYLYFTQKENVTYVNVMNDGVEGTPVSLEGDYLSGDFYDFSLTANRDGTAKLTVGTKTVDLTVSNTEGYVAIVTDGEGTAEVAIGPETNLTRFIYRSSDGKAVENNFNTGFIPSDDFKLNSTKAVLYANPDEAKGLIFEDGKLRFAGTSDGTYLATQEKYADYIVEFKLEEYNEADHPKGKDGKVANSRLAVNLAVADGSGWASSIMICLTDNAIVMQDFSRAPMLVKSQSISYALWSETQGKTKITAVKIIALNNVVTVYYQEVKDGETPTKDKYVKGAEFSVLDTYGKVAFATTDSAYFNIDDVRITPIDNPDPAVVEKNLADYVDFKEIADTPRPVKLDAPELTLDGNTVKWAAVENATGYIVKVNDTEKEVGADVLSYAFQAAGEYTVTVTAKGNGETALNSDESDPLVFTIENTETSGGDSASQGTSGSASEGQSGSSSGGCGSVAGAAFLSLIAAAGAAFVIGKRKND